MCLQTWKIGLDIQDGYYCAVAASRRRYGWQLRQWWHQKLPLDLFNQQGINKPDILSNTLLQWRYQLPRKYSLRIAIPGQSVLQKIVPMAHGVLDGIDTEIFITASLNKLFPLPAKELVFDYRYATKSTDPHACKQPSLIVTAARQSALRSWLEMLSVAGLTPQVIDVVPLALRIAAQNAGIPTNALLLHAVAKQWLLIAPLQDPFCYTFLDGAPTKQAELSAFALDSYRQLSSLTADNLLFSGSLPETILSDPHFIWSPFSAFQQIQPPLPAIPSLFSVACGLALRPEDRL